MKSSLCFSVRPPKKSWKNISNLSGGEKTLSSLALVRAHLVVCIDDTYMCCCNLCNERVHSLRRTSTAAVWTGLPYNVRSILFCL